ncbi:Rho guanine nucleotide exchange factor 8-like protein [Tanacetum coccineum]
MPLSVWKKLSLPELTPTRMTLELANRSSLMVLGYKTGLESVEEKLEFYKKNESVCVENINGLKWAFRATKTLFSGGYPTKIHLKALGSPIIYGATQKAIPELITSQIETIGKICTMETYPRRCYVLMYNYSKEKRVKVPPGGLSDESRKWMHHQKDCCSQVLKASIAINAQVLSEMEIPETYIDDLPKALVCREARMP